MAKLLIQKTVREDHTTDYIGRFSDIDSLLKKHQYNTLPGDSGGILPKYTHKDGKHTAYIEVNPFGISHFHNGRKTHTGSTINSLEKIDAHLKSLHGNNNG